MSDHNFRFNNECKHMSFWTQYLHHIVCQINMSDLMMNVHTCVSDSTTYTMAYVRCVCVIKDEGTHMSYW